MMQWICETPLQVTVAELTFTLDTFGEEDTMRSALPETITAGESTVKPSSVSLRDMVPDTLAAAAQTGSRVAEPSRYPVTAKESACTPAVMLMGLYSVQTPQIHVLHVALLHWNLDKVMPVLAPTIGVNVIFPNPAAVPEQLPSLSVSLTRVWLYAKGKYFMMVVVKTLWAMPVKMFHCQESGQPLAAPWPSRAPLIKSCFCAI
mmetsp:Transcript_44751/g.113283  ORF Transcript_44751/g.113283 Transcript_44751/m.113283 type:complete len:204 (+) Transcript_44751:356-967(+)